MCFWQDSVRGRKCAWVWVWRSIDSGREKRSMVSELATWTETLVFMIWKHRQTLTPRLMNNVECKLTGTIFHLCRQEQEVRPGSQVFRRQDRKGSLAGTRPPVPHAQVPKDPPLSLCLRSQRCRVSRGNIARPSTQEPQEASPAFASSPNKTASHQPPRARLPAHGQTYSELVQQQGEHMHGCHGAVDPHVGHRPIGRSKH